MNRIQRTAVALVMAALAGVQGSHPSAQSTAPAEIRSALIEQLRGAIDAWAATPGHRGVSASVVLADGSQWSSAAGVSGDEPLREDHLIVIASITKTMTGAVILQLVDEGVLHLDDPIGRWLTPRLYVDPAITIQQLLNHTNGLANYTTVSALGTAINADPAHVFTPEELLGFVGQPGLAPGTSTQYTNTAFLLLGLIAERATNRSIIELYHQRLWKPLGLTEIFLPGYEEAPGRSGHGLQRRDRVLTGRSDVVDVGRPQRVWPDVERANGGALGSRAVCRTGRVRPDAIGHAHAGAGGRQYSR